MKRTKTRLIVGMAACLFAASGCSRQAADDAQTVADGAMNRNASSWRMGDGDWTGSYSSSLTKIDPDNVATLGLAWEYDLASTRGQESTPVMVDGILYASTNWGRVVAVDAVTGKERWAFDPEVDETADATLESAIATSIKAAYWLAQRATPFLRRSGAGRLLFVSSICGPSTVVPGMTAYAITKSGINSFIRSAALELIGDGITVNGVEPGVTWTEGMRANSTAAQRDATLPSIPARRFAEPEEIARAILFLAEPGAGYITGQTIVVDGGMSLSATDVGNIGQH